MTNRSILTNNHCIPCRGGMKPLGQKETTNLLEILGNNWNINDSGHLYKRYIFKDFMGALNFANKIGAIAEKEGHHPDITISWGACSLEIWTHKINGLTESDFVLAAKIDHIYT